MEQITKNAWILFEYVYEFNYKSLNYVLNIPFLV